MWKVDAEVPLDYYFNPISHIFATKWLGPEQELYKKKIIEKCLKLGSIHAPFAKVTCLLFFRDAFAQNSDESAVKLQNAVLAGAKLLFQSDLKNLSTTYREIFKGMISLVASTEAHLIKTHLWTDFYQTLCRFYFWYAQENLSSIVLL